MALPHPFPLSHCGSHCPSAPSSGLGLGLRGSPAQALLRQPLHERPHLLQLLEAASPCCSTTQIRGGGRGRIGPTPAHGHHHAERGWSLHTSWPWSPGPPHRLLLLRVTSRLHQGRRVQNFWSLFLLRQSTPITELNFFLFHTKRNNNNNNSDKRSYLLVKTRFHLGRFFLMAFCNIAAGSRFLCFFSF